MVNREIKYIRKRIKWLEETAKELKEVYKKTKLEIINELRLEVFCYSRQIESKLKLIERRLKK